MSSASTSIAEISVSQAKDGLWEEYALAREPVVIRGLFAGQPIAEASDVDSARKLLGTMPVMIREEYSRVLGAAERREAAPPQPASLADYMRHYGEAHDSGQVVTELDAPPALLELFDIPSFCQPIAPTHDLFVHAFVAGPDNYAHLHFDQDQRHVLLAQVFGRKRVVVLPPTASRWVHPFGNLGSIRPQAMSDSEREHFLAVTGGKQTILEPSDAVFMPVLVWHYTDYLDFGMSFNIRFRRNEYNRFLSADNFLGDCYLQAVSAPFGSVPAGTPLPPDLADMFAEITAAYDADYPDRMAKYQAMRRAFRDIALRRGLLGRNPLFLFPLDDITEQQAAQSMRDTFLYQINGRRSAELMHVQDAPASAYQLRSIGELATAHGYPEPLLEKVLRNKFARSSVEALTRDEAARMFAYLSSPAAAVAFEGAAR